MLVSSFHNLDKSRSIMVSFCMAPFLKYGYMN
jgi:hypothetical protein